MSIRPRLTYIICSTPRSGSSLLCSALSDTGIAGNPEEYFVPWPWLAREVEYSVKFNVHHPSKYLNAVVRTSMTTNGIWGTKLHAFQVPSFIAHIEASQDRSFTSLREALETVFPKVRYIFLRREDQIAQAISYYRAVATREWWRYSEDNIPMADKTLRFSQYGIKRSLQIVEDSDTYWKEFFRFHRLSPLQLTYESLEEDYVGTVQNALRYLGLSTEIAIVPPRTKKMADARSHAWKNRFLLLEKENPASIVPIKVQQVPFFNM